MELICFPEIKKCIDPFSNKYPMDSLCRAHYFHFISTNELAEVTYITSVHFKEIMLCERGAFVIPKAVCVASKQPIFSLQQQLLEQIFNKVVLKNNSVSNKAFNQALQNYDNEYDQPPDHDYQLYIFKFMSDVIMCQENRRIRDGSSPRNSPSRKSSKA